MVILTQMRSLAQQIAWNKILNNWAAPVGRKRSPNIFYAVGSREDGTDIAGLCPGPHPTLGFVFTHMRIIVLCKLGGSLLTKDVIYVV